MIDVDREFPHSYEIEDVPELPGSGGSQIPRLYFPRPITRPEHDGAYLKVIPATGRSWVGVFGFGDASPAAISRVLSSPDPRRVCVISKGAGYIVSSDDPETWEALDLMPITNAYSVPEHRLLVFGDFSRLVAHDGNRLVWQSPRLCWDSLKITNISLNTIEGVGYDPTSPDESRFAVDVRTGQSLFPPPLSNEGRPFW